MKRIFFVVVVVCLVVSVDCAHAQYFGRNKVVYEAFDFRVLGTDHFDIHYYPAKYPEGAPAIQDAARLSERWYARLSGLFDHHFNVHKPIIFYENQTDFHQTNIIGSTIGEGTGGITEGLKNRLFMPLTGSYADTDHVLGHEMVHVFQYDIAQTMAGTGAGLRSMNRLPLWMIEGMAEYLSLGPEDPHTAMWLRDALLRDALPTLQDLLMRPDRYFPYRWGHAFWAYVAGQAGDAAVPRLYKLSLSMGFEASLDSLLGRSSRALSRDWQNAIRTAYGPLLEGRTRPRNAGERLLAPDRGSGRINLAPSVSPDGKYVAYISEKDLFSIELFLADARTGQTIKKLTSSSSTRHYNALRFIDSAGSWSPDGRQFVFVVFAKGRNELAVLDVASRKVRRRVRVDRVDEIANPAWSPDGEHVGFSGIAEGQSDLYLLDLATGETRRLTNDRYADLQPTWSPDGETIAFVTDRGEQTDFARYTYGPMQVGLYHRSRERIQVLSLFDKGRHTNPQYAPGGQHLYFISDHDGFSDIYRMDLSDGAVYRVTRLATGVHGITELSPAMSVARNTGEVLFSVFEGTNYVVYRRDGQEAQGTQVQGEERPRLARELPSGTETAPRLVQHYLTHPEEGLEEARTFPTVPYKPKLQLDYIAAQGGISLGTGGFVGNQFGASGGLFMSYSDLLGDHQVGATVFANGGVEDIGGQVFYLNQRRRFQWGGMVGHVPYLTVSTVFGRDTATSGEQNFPDEPFVGQLRERLFVDQVAALAAYPFSTTQRIEFSAGYTRFGFDRELIQHFTRVGIRERVELDNPAPLNLGQATAAYVGDRSFFGFTSPIKGQRFRFEVEPTIGTLQYVGVLADFRHYFFRQPFTLALRGLHVGQYGGDAEDPRAQSYYLGYGTLVRGYSFRSFDPEECTPQAARQDCPEFDRLQGSRAAVANLEFRIPVLGTDALGLVHFPWLPTELAAFVDAGVAWTRDQPPSITFPRRSPDRIPVVSAGIAARINVFGALILQPHMVFPFQRPDKGWHVWLTLAPGW